MKIQQKITIISSSLFGFIFLITSIIIYSAFYQSSLNIFYQELSRTAKISGMFYLERDELSQTGFKPIRNAFYNLSADQQVSIFDDDGEIAFNTKKLDKDWSERLEEIKHKGELDFRDGNIYYHGLFYKDNQGDFVVLVKAENSLIQDQKNNLISILIISFFVGMIILIFLSTRLSKLAYKPVRNIIKQVNTLNLTKHPLKLSYQNSQDELEELFQAFNNLLEEIETGYQQQKNFVDFSSHELKTPLANIISQLEISLQHNRNQEAYKKTSESVLQDAQQLKSILENLLTLSNLNKNVTLKQQIRVDEIVWDIIEKLSFQYSADRFVISLQIPPEHSKILEVKGNETLLYMALYNIIENAAKFSENKIKLSILDVNNRLQISVTDSGIGIPKKDLNNINQPFYRSDNTTGFKGNGLGMSIALKVFQLHNIQFHITSELKKYTNIQLTFLNNIKKD